MEDLKIIPLLSLIILAAACGKNSPFSEAYWGEPKLNRTEEVTAVQNFKVTITPLSDTMGDISGTVNISINETDVETTTQMKEVPQSLMIGQRSITIQTCSDLAILYPPPVIVNDTSEFKNVKTIDSGSRESLVAELQQDDSQNGDSVNIAGKSFVIKAYGDFLNTPVPQSFSLIPIACGIIEEDSSSSGGSAGGGTTTGGTTTGGTTTGGTTTGGTTTGGTTTGGMVGTIGGGIGGTTGTDGTIGGTTSGTTAGAIDGSIGGVTTGFQ